MESACFFEEFDIRVSEHFVEYWQNLVIHHNIIFLNFAAIRNPKLLSVYVKFVRQFMRLSQISLKF